MKKTVRTTTSFVLIAIMMLSMTMYQTAFAASKLGKVKGVAITSNAQKKTIKLSWKKVKGATGYVIYKNTKNNFKEVKASNIKKTKKTFKSLKLGKTYYFKIAAVKKTKKGKEIGKAIIKKVRLVKPEVTTTVPTTQTQQPTTTESAKFEPAKLIINGKDLSYLNLTTIDCKNEDARVPFIAVIEELGAEVTWHTETLAIISITKRNPVSKETYTNTYYLNTKANTLSRNGWLYNELYDIDIDINMFNELYGAVDYRPYFEIVEGDYIADKHITREIVGRILSAYISVDYDDKTVAFYTDYEEGESQIIKDGKIINKTGDGSVS